jgi:hypothetical protein
MLRLLLFTVVCFALAPAMAQTAPAAPEATRAVRALSALWRPVAATDGASIEAACAGALEEIEAVEAALPPVLTPESLARVRTLHGLLVVPTDDPQVAYFFPDVSMPWFTSGLGAVGVISETDGFVGVRDAAGADFALQLGRAGRQAMLRLRAPDGQILNFVGCAPTHPS